MALLLEPDCRTYLIVGLTLWKLVEIRNNSKLAHHVGIKDKSNSKLDLSNLKMELTSDDDSLDLWEGIKDAVDIGAYDDLNAYLLLLPDEISTEEELGLIGGNLLNICVKGKISPQFTLIAVNIALRWIGSRISSGDDFEPVQRAFYWPIVTDETLRFLIKEGGANMEQLVVQLNRINKPEVEDWLERAQNLFNEFGLALNLTQLRRLRKRLYISDSDFNPFVLSFLDQHLHKEEEYAAYPFWVINKGPLPDSLSLYTKYKEELNQANNVEMNSSLEEILDRAYTNMMAISRESGINLKERIRRMILNSDKEDAEQMIKLLGLSNWWRSLSNDTVLFNLFGPSNPSSDINENDFITKQDRMFTCMQGQYDEDEGRTYDWFTGNCDICLKKIRRRWHAIRLPLSWGYWRGCFCSFVCLRQYKDPLIDDIGISNYLINNLERNLNTYQIQDREDDEEDQQIISDILQGSLLNPGMGLYEIDYNLISKPDLVHLYSSFQNREVPEQVKMLPLFYHTPIYEQPIDWMTLGDYAPKKKVKRHPQRRHRKRQKK